MPEPYILDQTFDHCSQLTKGEYENCRFSNCNLAETDLSGFRFTDCTFTGCNLSLVKLSGTALRNIKFTDCKMLGLQFDTCHGLGLAFTFDGCQLNHSSFYKSKIKGTVFRNSQLKETDFAEADLTGSLFDNCDLLLASFDRTLLGKADFRTAYNYSIDPENSRIRKAKFSMAGLPGLLGKYDIDIEI